MRHEAGDLAHREGLSLNQFISLAMAEKITRLADYPWPVEAHSPDEQTKDD